MKILSLFVLALTVSFVSAQNAADTVHHKRFSYFGAVKTGALVGCADCKTGKEVTFTAALVNGVTIGNRLRAGITTAYDTYFDYKAIPVMGTIAMDLIGKKHKVFVQASYGRAWAWNSFGERNYGYKNSSGGAVYSAEIGYRLLYHELSVAITTGYQVQHVSSAYEYSLYSYLVDATWLATGSRTTIEENLKRVSINLYIGWH